MNCKVCNRALIQRKTNNKIKYECPNGKCPVLFAITRRGRKIEWIYKPIPRAEPL